jgi:hypothetical protein
MKEKDIDEMENLDTIVICCGPWNPSVYDFLNRHQQDLFCPSLVFSAVDNGVFDHNLEHLYVDRIKYAASYEAEGTVFTDRLFTRTEAAELRSNIFLGLLFDCDSWPLCSPIVDWKLSYAKGVPSPFPNSKPLHPVMLTKGVQTETESVSDVGTQTG